MRWPIIGLVAAAVLPALAILSVVAALALEPLSVFITAPTTGLTSLSTLPAHALTSPTSNPPTVTADRHGVVSEGFAVTSERIRPNIDIAPPGAVSAAPITLVNIAGDGAKRDVA